MAGRISIIGQIAEIDREIGERERLYPRMVNDGRMKEEQRVMLMDRIFAIRATLMFCRENETDIRAWMAEKKAGPA